MKKKLLLIAILFSAFFIGITNVNAEEYLQRDEESFKLFKQIRTWEYQYVHADSEKEAEGFNYMFPEKISKTTGGKYSLKDYCDIFTTRCDDTRQEEGYYIFGISLYEKNLIKDVNDLKIKAENNLITQDEADQRLEAIVNEKKDTIINMWNNMISTHFKKFTDDGFINYPVGNNDYYLLQWAEGNYDAELLDNSTNTDTLEEVIINLCSYSVIYNNHNDNLASIYNNSNNNEVTTDVKNPKTSDMNIYIALLVIGLFTGIIVVSSKRIKKLNKVSR